MAITLDRAPRKASAWSGLVLAAGAIATAFGAAACCALPLLFLSLGISTAWFTSIALLAAPFRGPLLFVSAVALLGGLGVLWHHQRTAMLCKPGEPCVSISLRVLTFVGLALGAVLLWAGYKYV